MHSQLRATEQEREGGKNTGTGDGKGGELLEGEREGCWTDFCQVGGMLGIGLDWIGFRLMTRGMQR